MRISAESSDPGYVNYRGPCRVFLDDVELKDVMAVDIEEGYAEVCLRDRSGNAIAWGGEIFTERKFGVVRIEAMSRAPSVSTAALSPDAARVAAKRELRKFF